MPVDVRTDGPLVSVPTEEEFSAHLNAASTALESLQERVAALEGQEPPPDPNAPPTTSGLPDVSARKGDPDLEIDLRLYFQDDGGTHDLTFSLVDDAAPVPVQIDNSIGLLTLSFPVVNQGEVTIRATDVEGLFVDASFFVNVADSPPPPPGGDVIETHRDSIPRFVALDAPHSVKNGNWSDPTVWSHGRVPNQAADQVRIQQSHSIRYDLPLSRLDAVEVLGRLAFAADVSTELRVHELTVLNGELVIEPADADVTTEIVFPSVPNAEGHHFKTGSVDEPGQDPSQYGNGLLVIGGKVTMTGVERTPYMRLAVAPRVGDRVLQLLSPVSGWRAGDRLVIPDTRHVNPVDIPNYWTYEPQWEVVTITSINPNGNKVTISEPLTFDHLGAVDADGSQATQTDGTPLLPHVANLTRNIILRSEDPQGVRGHAQFFGRVAKDIRFTAFKGLGRTKAGPLDNTTRDEEGRVTHIGTNQLGRYSDHNHHVWGPVDGLTAPDGERQERYQVIEIGNVIEDALKWGTTVHGTHHGLFKENVYFLNGGAAIATEDGSEYQNEFIRNFSCGMLGGSVGFTGNGTNIFDEGEQGDAFWFAGPFNIVEGNIAASSIKAGFAVFPRNIPHTRQNSRFQDVKVPLLPGADMMDAGQFELKNVREFGAVLEGCEIYGATTGGIHIWDVGDHPTATPNIINNTTIWHVTGAGNFFYYAAWFEVDGWLQRGDPAKMHASVRDGGPFNPAVGAALVWGGASCQILSIQNADIQNMTRGFYQRGRGAASECLFKDSFLDNWENMTLHKWSQNPPDGSRDCLLENVEFGEVNARDSLSNIKVHPSVPDKQYTTVAETNKFRNCLIRGESRSFDLYYDPEQLPDHVLEDGAIEGQSGLTNQEAWDQFGKAFAGRMVPDAPPTPAEATSLALSLGIDKAGVY